MVADDQHPGAEQWVPESVSDISALRTAAQDCRGCDLYEDATQAVVGDGPTPATLMLVGEQPGDQEDRVGEPFVGPAGRLLDKALEAAGIDPRGVFRTNAVKHFRFSGTRGKQRLHKSPSRGQVIACRPWLGAELDLVRPRGVVLLGATAGGALYGGSFRLGPVRGQPRPWPTDRLASAHAPDWVLATMHPSGVLRSRNRDDDFAALVTDLSTARSHS